MTLQWYLVPKAGDGADAYPDMTSDYPYHAVQVGDNFYVLSEDPNFTFPIVSNEDVEAVGEIPNRTIEGL